MCLYPYVVPVGISKQGLKHLVKNIEKVPGKISTLPLCRVGQS